MDKGDDSERPAKPRAAAEAVGHSQEEHGVHHRNVGHAAPYSVDVEGHQVRTPRLVLRRWETDDSDVAAALAIFGDARVARWLSPAMEQIHGPSGMREQLEVWSVATDRPPQVHWAVALRSTAEVIGGAALLYLPPGEEDLHIGWQIRPEFWGRGYGSEAGHAVAHYTFTQEVDEVFAVVRPANEPGSRTAASIGMDWVGETEKYFDLRLQVYRLRKGELDVPALPRL